MWPNGSDYSNAMQNPRVTLSDKSLADGDVSVNPMGLPVVFSGAFASVFRVSSTDGRMWAVKCFTRDVPDRQRRYEVISAELQRLRRPWAVGFEYQESGVLVDGKRFPVVKMEWIKAKSLTAWLEENLYDQARIEALASSFAAIAADLDRNSLTHGDLQHGNVLVDPSGAVRLIDYDGMYVPGLQGLGGTEKGHVNYQSPRRINQFGPSLDRFSAWVIWVSLRLIALDPGLWHELRPDGSEQLLFAAEDFDQVLPSPALAKLRATGRADLIALADQIAPVLRGAPDDVPELTAVGAGNVRTISGPSVQTDTDAVTGLPGWMGTQGVVAAGTGALPPGISQTGAAPDASAEPDLGGPVGAGWVHGHLPAPPPVGWGPPSGRLRRFGLAALCGLVLLSALLLAGAPMGAIVNAWLWTAVCWAAAFEVSYRTRTEVRRRREIAERLGTDKTEQRKLAAAVRKANAEVEARGSDGTKEMTAIAGERSRAATQEQKAARDIADELNKRLVDVQQRRNELDSTMRQREADALKAVQEGHVQAQLSRARLSSVSLHGIGPALVSTLARHGINSAADFSGTSGELIRRTNGGYMKVPGIGPAKASTLGYWRQQVVTLAQRNSPKGLDTSQRASLNQARNTAVAGIDASETSARATASQGQTRVAQEASAKRAELDRRSADVARRTAAATATAHQALAAARTRLGKADYSLGQVEAELNAYIGITRRSYLPLVLAAKS